MSLLWVAGAAVAWVAGAAVAWVAGAAVAWVAGAAVAWSPGPRPRLFGFDFYWFAWGSCCVRKWDIQIGVTACWEISPNIGRRGGSPRGGGR
jgi:hypothetical protein